MAIFSDPILCTCLHRQKLKKSYKKNTDISVYNMCIHACIRVCRCWCVIFPLPLSSTPLYLSPFLTVIASTNLIHHSLHPNSSHHPSLAQLFSLPDPIRTLKGGLLASFCCPLVCMCAHVCVCRWMVWLNTARGDGFEVGERCLPVPLIEPGRRSTWTERETERERERRNRECVWGESTPCRQIF